jgi:hypothetical protein
VAAHPFEVYPSLAEATDSANKVATSQIALPKSTCDLVYATEGYSQNVTNLAQVSLSSDNVFGDDGSVHQLGTVSGSVGRARLRGRGSGWQADRVARA